jgi:aldehyde dehydrogenase (NAD+)
VNPSNTSDVIGEYAQADRAQAESAIAARGRRFQNGRSPACSSARHPGPDRQRDHCAQGRVGHPALAREGKTKAEGIGEAARAGYIFKFFAGEAIRAHGELVPSVRPGIDVEITREPVGVIGMITPWNFPIAIPAWKIAPALAFGNCVVIKPADLVPGSVWALTEIISRTSLPPGVFNLVMGRGSVRR